MTVVKQCYRHPSYPILLGYLSFALQCQLLPVIGRGHYGNGIGILMCLAAVMLIDGYVCLC